MQNGRVNLAFQNFRMTFVFQLSIPNFWNAVARAFLAWHYKFLECNLAMAFQFGILNFLNANLATAFQLGFSNFWNANLALLLFSLAF
jgi:hypothetical protein